MKKLLLVLAMVLTITALSFGNEKMNNTIYDDGKMNNTTYDNNTIYKDSIHEWSEQADIENEIKDEDCEKEDIPLLKKFCKEDIFRNKVKNIVEEILKEKGLSK